MNSAPQKFTWGKVIYDLKLRGMSALLACHSEPSQYDPEIPSLTLEVNDAMRGMVAGPAMGQLTESLKEYFGDDLKLDIVYGPAEKSPVMIGQTKRLAKFNDAMSLFMNDDFIKDMLSEFGAKIVVESVKPVSDLPKP